MIKLKSEKVINTREPICRVLPAVVAVNYEYWELIPPARSFKAESLEARAQQVMKKLICLIHENDL
jgi:hypothetical protein